MKITELGIKVPKNKIEKLKLEGIETIDDIVRFFPKKYYDFTNPVKINSIRNEMTVSVIGKVIKLVKKPKVTYAKITDGTGYLYIYWFNQQYVSKIIELYQTYIFCGNVKIEPKMNNQKQMIPLFFNKDISKGNRIIPIYKKIKGISDEYMSKLIKKSFEFLKDEDFLLDINKNLFKRFNLIREYEALKKIHFPNNLNDTKKAKKRLIFDNLFIFNFQLKELQKR
ncbi:MAG: hypothetical protein GX954_08085, partial [Clostridium cochlearium]|nr:hypothetical protein [Clostridium cochlearium]